MQIPSLYSTVLVIILLNGNTSANAESLSIENVEPPNWWVGMKHNQVKLLIHGSGLSDLTAKFNDDQLSVSSVNSLASNSYALIEFSVPANTTPGKYDLVISNDLSKTILKYPILKRQRCDTRHQGFSNKDVVYLITPDRFANGDTDNDQIPGLVEDFDQNNPSKRHGGDIQGIIDHLDYLEELGVTALWLNPVLENNGELSYHGYAATDLYQIDPRFGDNGLYSKFVESAHDHNLKVIFDHVNNHVGINHPWVSDPPCKNWFNGSPTNHLRERHYLMAISDPHADPESIHMLKNFWFVKSMPDLNYKNRLLSDYRIQNTIWWIETAGFDGIREDTYPYVDQEHLARWANAIKEEYQNFNIVGEVWSTAPAYVARFQEGKRLPDAAETNLPALMDFPFMQACRNFVACDGTLREIYQLIAQDFLYSNPENLMVFVDNHDTPRIAYLSSGNCQRTKIVLTLLLTTRGIPQLLYGTELGMVGGKTHVEVRSNFPGGFSGQDHNAFLKEARSAEEKEWHNFIKKLLHIRKNYPALNQGKLIQYPVPIDNDVYKYLRVHNEQQILIAINGEQESREIDLSDINRIIPGIHLKNLLDDTHIGIDRTRMIRIPALTAGVFCVTNDNSN